MAKQYTIEFLFNAHKSSFKNKLEILRSENCACFYCKNIYLSSLITEWIDDGILGNETAKCPKCGIDAVLPDRLPISDSNFLSQMNRQYF